MSLSLYMDVHVPAAITDSLRLRGLDVLTDQEDGRRRAADDLLIERATELGRLLFSRDKDMLRHAREFQQHSQRFTGIVFASQRDCSIGQCVESLVLICMAGDEAEFADRVTFLPLR